MKYDNYIFDLDGTLLDTLADLAASCNYALRKHGMPERTIDEVRLFVGNGVRKLILRAVPEGTENALAEDVLATFRQHYGQHSLDTTCPYDGITDMLKAMKSQGKGLAVVSNKFSQATESLIAHFFGFLWLVRNWLIWTVSSNSNNICDCGSDPIHDFAS